MISDIADCVFRIYTYVISRNLGSIAVRSTIVDLVPDRIRGFFSDVP